MKDGVNKVQVILMSLITPLILFSLLSSLGTHTVPPSIKQVKISSKLASNVYDANCRTREVEPICKAGPCAKAPEQNAACSTTVPLKH